MKIFEVFSQVMIMDSYSLGLFATKEAAIEMAETVAVTEKFEKIDDVTWGEADDYGLMRGVYVVEREMAPSNVSDIIDKMAEDIAALPKQPPRDSARIEIILNKLKEVWQKSPDLRLGQLIINVTGIDPYFIEDEKLIKMIEEFYEKYN